jgi:drug/metabolite transporter (DMT)-like permease
VIIAFALSSALVFGAADFCGGAASRRAGSMNVLLMSMPTGLVLMLIVMTGLGGLPHRGALAWGTLAGLAGGTGLLVFYRALANGPMSVVAPVSGLMSALVPAVVGVARGDRLTPAALAGVLLCLVAICMVSVEKNAGPVSFGHGPALAVVAGTAFGLFFVVMRLGDDGTLWPLTISKAVGLLVVAAIAFGARRGSLDLPRHRTTIVIAILAGSLDVVGNGLYILAARAGMLSIAGVLSSLYPASTVLLARLVYDERLRPIQRVGLAVAVAGVGLVTIG